MNIEYLASGVALVTPSPSEEAVLRNASHDEHATLEGLDQATAIDNILKSGEALSADVPLLTEFIGELATHQGDKAAVLRFNPPQDDRRGGEIGFTPNTYRTPDQNTISRHDLIRGYVLGIAQVYPFGYESQQPGNIWNDVIAIAEQTKQKVEGASATASLELGLHSEDASYNLIGGRLPDGTQLDSTARISPDWLTLHFQRNPDDVPTFISVPELRDLPAQSLAFLQQPWFRNHTNPGQGGSENDIPIQVGLVYEDPETNALRLRINEHGIEAVADAPAEAHAALADLRALLAKSVVDLPSTPGSIVLIDNTAVLHGRRKYATAQQPRWDGFDRWQRRIVAVDAAAKPLITAYESSPHIVDTARFVRAMRQLIDQAA